MAQIDSTASNIDMMREHMLRRQLEQSTPLQDEDLCVCSHVIDIGASNALNSRVPPSIPQQSRVNEFAANAAYNGGLNGGAAKSGECASAESVGGCESKKECTAVGKDNTAQIEEAFVKIITGEMTTLRHILEANPNDMALVSDVDEQLLLKIQFKSPVKVSSIFLRATVAPKGFAYIKDDGTANISGDEETVSGPKDLKVFANKDRLDFASMDEEQSAFSVSLTQEDLEEPKKIFLPGSKFQLCNSVQILIETNQASSDYTFLNRLSLFGAPHKSYTERSR